ncbi:MAG: hypothetical protein IT244_11715 [Bacteroidia bacterium]|nr:hypothetical protein [Bacteroidia bacterium]
MYRPLIFLTFGLLSLGQAKGQNTKAVLYLDSAGINIPVSGIRIAITPSGETVTTDKFGKFKFTHLGKSEDKSMLVFYYSPNLQDTVFYSPEIHKPQFFTSDKYLQSQNRLNTANVVRARVASSINSRGIQKVEIINEEEFKKAACCTLSESFETNNTVEVSNADGVSGIRQVEMLGLAGKYVLMTRDNIPAIRGLNVLTGLNQIPGPMVSGVHISKGVGSVTNGFEGITGGLNYALKSEHNDPILFINAYGNGQGRAEGNVIVKSKINKNAFNHSYLHYGSQFKAHDRGGDGFTDIPLYQRVFFGDQFKYYGKKAETQIGFTYMNDKRDGGDIHLYHDIHDQRLRFQFNMQEERAEAFAKLGIFLDKDGHRSIGNILYISQTKSTAVLNNMIERNYSGLQKNIHFTSLYGSDDEKKMSIKTGISVMYDDVNETLKDTYMGVYNPKRKELSTGAFFEWVLKTKNLVLVLGNRLDWNSIYKLIYTPRLHLKYEVTKNQQLHFQAGVGRRTPWIFAENLPNLITNRKIITTEITGNIPENIFVGAYSMPQEQAWNLGGSYTFHFMALQFPSTLSVDAYYTYFKYQLVADRDRNLDAIILETQRNNSTTMAQVDWLLKPHRHMDIKLSYRYVNAIQNLGNTKQIQPMQAPHRALVVVNYNTRSKWFFDAILQVNSPKRLPSTQILPEAIQMAKNSPWYSIVNVQIRKNYRKWEFYSGIENILNIRQNNPVLNTTFNNKEYFDAAFAWGPTMGRNVYLGFRWSIGK